MAQSRKHYNATAAKKAYFESNQILEKAGKDPHAKWVCENPDCKCVLPLSEFELHHLLPRFIAPSLTYKTSNMLLLCPRCHETIEKNGERERPPVVRIKTMKFCEYCGLPILHKRNKICDDYFHPECMIKFLKDGQFKKYTSDLNVEEKGKI